MAGLLKELRELPSALGITTGGGDYLHIKQGDSDRKITVFNLLKDHNTDIVSNPHGITPTMIGLGNLTNAEQLVKANNLTDVGNTLTARTHLAVYSKTETDTKVSDHANLTNNPHSVTSTQVGLGNLNNWVASTSENDNNDTKYATASAVYKASQSLLNFQQSLVGEVKMSLTTAIPTGYLEIRGQTYSWLIANGYPVLASKFPAGLPDTRGRFPRGWANDQTSRDAGRVMASTQNDENKSHSHTTSSDGAHVHTVNGQNKFVGGANTDAPFDHYSSRASSQDGSWYSMPSAGNHTHTINPTGSESRPLNFALMFIIRHDIL